MFVFFAPRLIENDDDDDDDDEDIKSHEDREKRPEKLAENLSPSTLTPAALNLINIRCYGDVHGFL